MNYKTAEYNNFKLVGVYDGKLYAWVDVTFFHRPCLFKRKYTKTLLFSRTDSVVIKHDVIWVNVEINEPAYGRVLNRLHEIYIVSNLRKDK